MRVKITYFKFSSKQAGRLTFRPTSFLLSNTFAMLRGKQSERLPLFPLRTGFPQKWVMTDKISWNGSEMLKLCMKMEDFGRFWITDFLPAGNITLVWNFHGFKEKALRKIRRRFVTMVVTTWPAFDWSQSMQLYASPKTVLLIKKGEVGLGKGKME